MPISATSTNSRAPRVEDANDLAAALIDRVGPRIVLALPLGLGKANHIANALYDRVAADPGLSLTIVTALTLEKPYYGDELQRRFLGPIAERLFDGYPELHYAEARRRGTLPDNIRVEEFFFLAGSQLGNPSSQQQFICANYTHALNCILDRGINVLAQLVASDAPAYGAERYCLSCNTDLSGDLLEARRQGQADFVFVGQVNGELPLMGGDGLVGEAEFDFILEGDACQFPLFAPPKEPIYPEQYAAALHIARLIPDGGTLQMGIGAIGDALAHCLILRHRHNRLFRHLLEALDEHAPEPPGNALAPFKDGLHGLSEMLVEGFLDLWDADILKREVEGKVLYAAFFLGSRSLYQRLRNLDHDRRDKIAMCSVLFANELYGDEDAKRRQRLQARFVNKAMMASLLGEIFSDTLANGQTVSGVGGQYNFAAQAFALDGARSILALPATRTRRGEVHSNLVWSQGHATLPKHLRDIVVTEYGCADLRGKTDAEAIAAMLNICDSRFQQSLRQQAVAAGKLPRDYQIPAKHRHNDPERVRRQLEGFMDNLPPFPLGSDFDTTERQLLPVLQHIQNRAHSKKELLLLALQGLMGAPSTETQHGLTRLRLDKPGSFREGFLRYLVKGAYHQLEGKVHNLH